MSRASTNAASRALFAQAVEAYRAGLMREAEARLERVLQVEPQHHDALHLLGLIAYREGRQERAVSLLSRALSGNRKSAERHAALGAALIAADRPEEAASSFRRALALRPADSMAHSNFGEALRRLERAAEAEASLRRAIALDTANRHAHYNLGVLLYETRRYAEAVTSFRSTLALDPQSALYHTHLAYALLAGGQLEEGWREHEWRFGVGRKAFPRNFSHPHWEGEPLEGRSLLMWMEQGIGEQLLFASLVPDLAQRAARCVIECAPKLTGLFRRSFPGVDFVAASDPPHPRTQEADLQVAAGDAGRWLRPTVESFPRHAGYLRAAPERVAYWKERLRARERTLTVGFSWRSGDVAGIRALSMTGLDQWGPVFAMPGVRFVCLQYGECGAELAGARTRFGVELQAFPEVDLFNDLEEASALTAAVDLVITAPTATSMLAAALGVETWRTDYGSDWKTLGTDRDPWLPAVVRFDRAAGQPWEEIIRAIARKLAARAAEF